MAEYEETEFGNTVEELAEEIISLTENKDDLENNITTFISDLEQKTRNKILELTKSNFCSDCGAKMKAVLDDIDGTNMEEITSCPNSECPSNH
jgi:hypothetical protein